jgi:hypothetical protein
MSDRDAGIAMPCIIASIGDALRTHQCEVLVYFTYPLKSVAHMVMCPCVA